MLRSRRSGFRLVTAAAGAWLGLAEAGSARAAPTTTLVYERTLMQTAGERCRLFRPDVLSALTASAAQARGAAIRGGLALADVQGAVDRAKLKAYSVPCSSKDLAVAAARLRAVYDTYAQLRTMSFPGQFADWRAERLRSPAPGKVAASQWTLLQFAPGARQVLFGLSSIKGGVPFLTAVNVAPSSLAASTARLIVRDPLKSPAAYVDDRRRALATRIPPRDLDQVFVASAKFTAPASLLPPGARGGQAFGFPSSAVAALAGLDPREAAMLELAYPTVSGDHVEAAWIEVGDFAAAQAFLTVRPPPRPAAR